MCNHSNVQSLKCATIECATMEMRNHSNVQSLKCATMEMRNNGNV